MRRLRTTGDVIDALGGNAAIAEMLAGTNVRAVANWRLYGKFPAHTYVAINAALKAKRCEAPGNLWPMTALKIA